MPRRTNPTDERIDSAETQVGLVVEVSQDHTVVVELSDADGARERYTAHTLVPLDSSMMGRPVELMFFGDRLDRPVITRQLDLHAEIQAQWDALGREVLGLDQEPRQLPELIDRARALACTAALLTEGGNVTHGAASMDTSRRTLREHVRRWKRSNPRFAFVLAALDGRRHIPRVEASPGSSEPSVRTKVNGSRTDGSTNVERDG